MENRKLLRIGGIGTVVTAVCCFTPILVVALSALGLVGTIAYLDMVLFPVLFMFILLLSVALFTRMRRNG